MSTGQKAIVPKLLPMVTLPTSCSLPLVCQRVSSLQFVWIKLKLDISTKSVSAIMLTLNKSMEPPLGFVHLSLFKQDNRVLSADEMKERLFYLQLNSDSYHSRYF